MAKMTAFKWLLRVFVAGFLTGAYTTWYVATSEDQSSNMQWHMQQRAVKRA